MQGIRKALSTIGIEERRKIADAMGVTAQVKQYWQGGKICGQCQGFSQLGGRGSGLNGACSVGIKTGYTKPEDKSCNRFQRCAE